MVREWHDFYVVAGGAAAALLGLLFVRADAQRRSDPRRQPDAPEAHRRAGIPELHRRADQRAALRHAASELGSAAARGGDAARSRR